MQRQQFQYYIMDSSGRTFYIDNDNIKKSGPSAPKSLPNAPDGWSDQMLRYERNQTYKGVFAAYTFPIKFVLDGAAILRYIAYQLGPETIAYLGIAKLDDNPTSPTQGTYIPYFKGEIDLNPETFKDDPITGVEVNIIQGGLLKYIKAYEQTNYEIPLEAGSNLLWDGIKLQTSLAYSELEVPDFVVPEGSYRVIPPVIFQNNDGPGVGTQFKDSDIEATNDNSYGLNSANWFFYAEDFDVEITIRGLFTVTPTSNNDLGYTVIGFGYITNKDTYTATRTYFLPGGAFTNSTIVAFENITNGNPKTYTLDHTILIEKGTKLFFMVDSLPFNGRKFSFSVNDISIDYTTRKAASIVKILNPAYVAQQLVNKMTGTQDYTVIAPILRDVSPWLVSGDGIRGIDGAVLKTSFREFFTNYMKQKNIGFRINETAKQIIFDYQRNFYTNDVIYDLGEVSEVVIEFDTTKFFSGIKAGCPNQNYDNSGFSNLNGKYEFNATTEYNTPQTRVANVLDLVTTYRKDAYGAEYTRYNLDGKKTTDSKSDNDVFMIDVEGLPVLNNIGLQYQDGPTSTIRINGIPQYQSLFGIGVQFTITNADNTDFNNSYTVQTVAMDGTTIVLGTDVVFSGTAGGGSGTITFLYEYILKRRNYDTVEGLLYDNLTEQWVTQTGAECTWFNIELSPARMVRQWGDYIKACMFKQGNKFLTWQTTSKNNQVATTIGGVRIAESDDLLINNFSGAYFYPITVKFKTIVPDALFQLMQSPYGKFQFTLPPRFGEMPETKRVMTGYAVSCSQQPSMNEPQEWTLLLSIDNDLNNLLNG